MSIHFHPIPVKEVHKETPSCVSIVLDIPPHLQSLFAFREGQNLTFRLRLNDQEIRRSYSLCSSPHEGEWRVAVKKVEDGLFSCYANDNLKAGDILEVMPPVGTFNTDISSDHKKNYIAFAAGSGITPVLSIIKTVLHTEPASRFTLVYGNKTRQDIIFLEELEGLKNLYTHRFQLLHILSREQVDSQVLQGRIDAAKMEELSNFIPFAGMDEFFICGPEQMIFSVKEYLEQKGINSKKIHFELFTSSGQVKAVQNKIATEEKATPASKINMRLDGRFVDFLIEEGSDISLLDAALATGADLPYACKGGVCCTCKAKLLEGEVHMDVHWGLAEEEIEKGYILTCQSHPRSAVIKIDFDDR